MKYYSLLRLLFFLHLITCTIAGSSHEEEEDDDEDKKDSHGVHGEIQFPPHNYDPTESGKHGEAQNIKMSLFIEAIIRINPSEMEFIVYTYLNQEWVDERLKRTNHHVVVLQEATKVWVPDVYCLNCRKSTLNNQHSKVMLRISEDGEVYFSQPGLFHAACKFQYKDFPFDSQQCFIQFSSYSYNNSFVNYHWAEPVVLQKTHLEQFTVERHVSMFTEIRKYNAGNFTVLGAQLTFTRQTGFYVIRLFVPSAMLVCLSWIAFYISPTEVGDRLAIGITLILSMIFLLGYVDSSLPKVSYVKAIDWYLIMALVMIVSSVIETIIAYVYLRNKLKKELEHSKALMEIGDLATCDKNGNNNNNMKKELESLVFPKEQNEPQNGISNNPNKRSEQLLQLHERVTTLTDLEEGMALRRKRKRYGLNRPSTVANQTSRVAAQEELRSKIFGESYVKNGFVAKMELSAQVLFPLIYLLYNLLYIHNYVYHNK